MFLRNDARRTQRNVRTDQRVFGLWSVAQTTADGTASAKVNGGGKRRRSRRCSAAVASVCFFLLSSSICFNGGQLLLLAGTHGGPTASPRGLPYNEVAPGVDLTTARVSGEQH